MSEELDIEVEDGESLLITLEDEDGVEHEFEVIDTLEYHSHDYYALMPTAESEVEELDGELVILKADEQDGEEFLAIIEDDDEYSEVVDLFMRQLAETFGEDFIQFEEIPEEDLSAE